MVHLALPSSNWILIRIDGDGDFIDCAYTKICLVVELVVIVHKKVDQVVMDQEEMDIEQENMEKVDQEEDKEVNRLSLDQVGAAAAPPGWQNGLGAHWAGMSRGAVTHCGHCSSITDTASHCGQHLQLNRGYFENIVFQHLYVGAVILLWQICLI